MTVSVRTRFGTLALGVALLLSGCKSKPAAVAIRNADGSITNPDGSVTYPAGSQQAQTAAQPSTPPAPGVVRNPDGSVTYPANQPAPAAETASAPAEAPVQQAQATPPPAEQAPVAAPVVRPSLVVPSGTRVEVSISQTLSASRNNAGDSFSGSLAQPIVTTAGKTVFPRGANVAGTVIAAKGKGRFKGSGALGIQISSIDGHSVSTTEYEKDEKGRGKRTAGFIGGGGGVGALIGGLAGGGKGALLGGLAGAGAGTAAGAYTGNRDVVIPAESVVVFRTTSAIRVR